MLEYFIDHMDHDFTVTQTFKPESLHFILNDEDVSTIEYEISATARDTSGDLVITGDDFISPHHTHWQLRYGPDVVIMAGIHTSVKMSYRGNYMSVSGSDWMWYLDQRFMPFDGRINHAYDFTLNSPIITGVNYDATVDIAIALTAVLDMALGITNSLPITYSLSDTGITDYFRLDLADSTTLLEIIKDFCGRNPGVAFRVLSDRTFVISSDIRWYGNPDDVANNALDSFIVWTIDDSHPPLLLDYTNTGPRETHIQGEGSGTVARNVVTLGNTENQEAFWRTDRAEQFPNAITRDTVIARTGEQLAFDLNPVHEIPLSLDPDVVDAQYASDHGHSPGADDGFFWTYIKPGEAIWIDLQLIAHHIDSAHHIVSMDCTVESNGVATVALTENQIYDTSGQAHVNEG